MEEAMKWESLNMDCLVNILGRVDLESRCFNVPLVCKSWFKATSNPKCWSHLDFTEIPSIDKPADICFEALMILSGDTRSSPTKFVQTVVKRSEGSAVFLKLPQSCSYVILSFIAEWCPNLRTLMLPNELPPDFLAEMIPSLIMNWKELEHLTLSTNESNVHEVAAQIGIHCKNFVSLEVRAMVLISDEARAVAAHIPKLKHLVLKNMALMKGTLKIILEGCKELEYLDVSGCVGFAENDEEILELGSHIRMFCRTGSMTHEQKYGKWSWPLFKK